VLVGGVVAGVLITDPAMPEIRPTQDVDVICRLIARSDYHQLGRQLRQRGLQPDRRQSTVMFHQCQPQLHLPLQVDTVSEIQLTNPACQQDSSQVSLILTPILPEIQRILFLLTSNGSALRAPTVVWLIMIWVQAIL